MSKDMTPSIARAMVVDWLRAGAEPTKELPFVYDYNASSVWVLTEESFACAGAAMAHLLGYSGATTVGDRIFGDGDTFFGKMVDDLPDDETDDPLLVADWLDNLEMKEEER